MGNILDFIKFSQNGYKESALREKCAKKNVPYIPAYKPSLELQKKVAKLRSRLICA